jgi:hypothetical protein
MNHLLTTGLEPPTMKLRDHPLMSYQGLPNWPPTWTWIGGEENKHPKGEVGILQDVMLSTFQPSNRCYLIVEHERAAYMGCLLFDDASFCSQIFALLRGHCGHPVQHIGGLNFSHPP